MTRTLTTNMATAAAAEEGTFVFLFELDFSGGTSRLTTAPNDIVWNSNTYTAVGGHLTFDTVQETPSVGGQGVRVTLDGVDQTIISALLNNNYIGRVARIYFVHLTAGAIVADPVLYFQGLMNSRFEIEETGKTCTVRTFLVSELNKFRQVRGINATLMSHQQHFNADTFMRHLHGIAARRIFWGKDAPPSTPGGGGGGGTVVGGGGNPDS